MKLSDRVKKIRKGQKLVFVPSAVQRMMCGIVAIELYPDQTFIRVYENGARVSAAMTGEHLNMSDSEFNIFKFTGD